MKPRGNLRVVGLLGTVGFGSLNIVGPLDGLDLEGFE